MEKIKSITLLLKKYGLIIIAVSIIETPIIWKIMNSIFQERIEILNSTIKFLETKVEQNSSTISNLDKSSGTQQLISDTTPTIIDANAYPQINNIERPSKAEIRQLAKFYNLFNTWKVNPHLSFQAGDISYFYEQELSLEQLKIEFESRRIVLERAEKSGKIIDTQGDLSYYAEQVQSELLRSK